PPSVPCSFPTRRSSDLFRSAVEADLVWLAIVGVVTSVISGYFYLRLVFLSFMYPPEGEVELHASPGIDLTVGVTLLATLVLGVLDRKSTRLNSSHVKIS